MKLCKRIKRLKIKNKQYEVPQYSVNIPNKLIKELGWQDDCLILAKIDLDNHTILLQEKSIGD